jgi:hypothetical protein
MHLVQKHAICWRKGDFFVMITTRIIQIISGIAGLAALTLGLLIWIANLNVVNIHMIFGLIVTLALLTMSIIAVSTRGLRIWGIAGIVYALIVPIFGMTQFDILTGNLHWLIRTAHLLVGIGALALTGTMATRYMALKRIIAKPAAESQVVR